MIKTRCSEGWLVLDERFLSIQGPKVNQSLMISEITNVRTEMQVPSVFGRGGGVRLFVSERGGNTLKATMVNTQKAEEIKKIIMR